MKRIFALVACVALVAPNAPAYGVQYDEISRSIMPGATAPPPGAFHSDYAQLRDGKLIAENPMMAQMPQQPAMPKLSGFSLLGIALNPIAGLASLAMQAAMGSITSGMMSKYRNYESGQLQRVAYYGGFGRSENVATKHVVITDVRLGKQYDVDLSAHSYKVNAFSAFVPAAPPSSGGSGTAQVHVLAQTTLSEGQEIEGAATDLYTTVQDVTIANASGKCRNMHMRMETVQYVAKNVAAPSGNTATFDRIYRDHPELAAGPDCAASVTASSTGPAVPSNRLVLYSRTTLSFPDMDAKMQAEVQAHPDALPAFARGPMHVVAVTERGNVRQMANADVTALFAVPAGFTQSP